MIHSLEPKLTFVKLQVSSKEQLMMNYLFEEGFKEAWLPHGVRL